MVKRLYGRQLFGCNMIAGIAQNWQVTKQTRLSVWMECSAASVICEFLHLPS